MFATYIDVGEILIMSAQQYIKPLPDIHPETAGFWKAAKKHKLVFQKCMSCGQKIYFPRLMCYDCFSSELEWIPSTGSGTVYSYTIIHQQTIEGFAAEEHYVYAIIELNEGVRMISNIINIEPTEVRIGMRVRVTFEEANNEISIPRFEPC